MEQTQEGLRLRQVLTDYFDKHKEILLARLFGSVAQGRETAKSDVDIAVHGREPLGAEQLVSMQQDLELLCGREVDLADLRVAEGLFLYKIMTKGCPLKHQPEIHHHYAMKALCFYEDFYPLVRRMQMERAVQLCVDIAAHLLSETGAPVPDTMAGTFRTLSAQGTLTPSLADKLCKAVGFRNIAVHQYQDINHKILYAVVTEHLQDFRDFAKAVVVLMGS